MEKVAVIVLNWNGEKLLHQYLPSVLSHTPPCLGRVVVVDNHSDDRSVELLKNDFPDVELVCFDKNYGFAGGYNRIIAQVEAEYVVLLNSDVEGENGWLQPLVDVLDNQPDVAAVPPHLRSW
ncbi:MAG: glycosyltransferase, partial [Odoribacter sp.]|nr:glycosyltransferase [Odoribacter sp.]